MKNTIKFSLVTLFLTNALFGMEMPPGKATLAENDIIQIHAHDTTLAKIERRHIKSSPMLKYLIDETSTNNGIELPESIINDFKIIQDYLICEYDLKEKSTNEKAILQMLSSKSEQELTIIANACQRFELNLLSPLPIKILAQKLNTHERLEECLEKGSFKLPLTPDTSRLLAQEMLKSNTSVKMYWLIIEEIIKNKRVAMIKARFPSRKTEYGYHGSDHINRIFVFGNLKWAYVDEVQRKKINADAQNVLGCPLIEESNPFYPYIFSEDQGKLFVIQLSNTRSDNYFDTQLTPEQFVLLQQRKFDRMLSSVSDRKIVNYAGIENIRRTMPANIQALLDHESWWDIFLTHKGTKIAAITTLIGLLAYLVWH